MSGRIARSYLYVPADATDRLPKAAASAADAIIVDLEDAVLLDRKAQARAVLREWLDAGGPAGKPTWIRVNDGDQGTEDLEAIAGAPGLHGLVIAKATESSVRAVSAWVDDAGLGLQLSPLLETAESLLQAQQIAKLPRVQHLQLGEVDLAADLGVPQPAAPEALLHARSLVVTASAAARLTPPVAAVSVEVRDLEAFAASTAYLKALGFFGRACIHPAQVGVANEQFTPTAAEVDAARAVLEDFALAEASGTGVALDRNGRLIDEAVLRGARRMA